MKRTAIAVAGMSLTQCLVAAVIGMPMPAQAQARPNIAETMAPVPGRKNYAQDLVDRAVARHPELLQLDIHAIPPGSTASTIIAAKDRTRVGKSSDPDDIAVLKPGEAIRDELARRISYGSEDLVTPAQYDPRVPIDTYAQYLVDDTLEKEPAVLIMVLHLQDPKADGYPILASNIGRIGKEADASDLAVIRGGATKLAVSADGTRLEAKLPVRDAAGNVVGAVAIVFPLRGAGDQASLGAHAERIRDGLARRIASMTALYGPYPATADSGAVQAEYNKQELGNQQSLPMTKAITSGEKLEQASQEGYSEAIKGVAGVSPANSKGTANDSVNIRGIKLNLFSNYRLNGGLPTVGVITVPTEDKERIETLKGANALMFGVASPAGIINLVTKRAGEIDVTSIAMAGNSFGQIGGSFDVGRRFA